MVKKYLKRYSNLRCDSVAKFFSRKYTDFQGKILNFAADDIQEGCHGAVAMAEIIPCELDAVCTAERTCSWTQRLAPLYIQYISII